MYNITYLGRISRCTEIYIKVHVWVFWHYEFSFVSWAFGKQHIPRKHRMLERAHTKGRLNYVTTPCYRCSRVQSCAWRHKQQFSIQQVFATTHIDDNQNSLSSPLSQSQLSIVPPASKSTSISYWKSGSPIFLLCFANDSSMIAFFRFKTSSSTYNTTRS